MLKSYSAALSTMDRLKLLMTIAPIVALVIAVSYLQGYWWSFDLMIFPYLTFNELLAYCAIPLFGFVIFSILGAVLGLVAVLVEVGVKSKWWEVAFFALLILTCVALVAFDMPEKWTIGFIVGALLFATVLPLNKKLSERIREFPSVYVVFVVSSNFIAGSFGYGLTNAQKIRQNPNPSVEVSIDGTAKKTRLLGKVNSQYFFLDLDGKVSQYPESVVKKITYERIFVGK